VATQTGERPAYAPPADEGIDASDPGVLRITTRDGRVIEVHRRPASDGEGSSPPAADRPVLRVIREADADVQRVVGLAGVFRAATRRDAVHVEHLLTGLLAAPQGITRLAFLRAGVPLGRVLARLQALGADAEGVAWLLNDAGGTDDRAVALPADAPISFSSHANAVYEAARVRNQRGPGASAVVTEPDLLRGLTSVTECRVVQLFADVWPHALALLDDLDRGIPPAPDEAERHRAEGLIDAIARAPASGTGELPVPIPVLTTEELEELLGSLSVSARKALGVADALRRERGADAVHMEQLLVGAYVEEGGHQRFAFDRGGVSPRRIAEVLRGFELPLRVDGGESDGTGGRVVAPSPAVLDAMPAVSKHARLALSAAAFAAGWTPGRSPAPTDLQASHLLAGLFGVRDCQVARAFAPARPAILEALRQGLDAAAASGEVPAELVGEQRRRLALLLDDATRVVFTPLDGAARDAAPLTDTPAASPPPAPTAPLVGAGRGGTNDRAEGEDQLGFSYYVGAFAELIDSPDTRPPLTIGIFGSWGAGKSFLLAKLKETVRRRSSNLRPSELREAGRLLSRRLRGEKPPERERRYVYCVDFNAWEYNASAQIWPRLVRRVLDGVEASVRFRERPLGWVATRTRRVARNLWRLARDGWKALAAWGAVAALLTALVTWDVPGPRTSLFEFVVGTPIDDKLSLSLLFGALASLAKLIKDALLAPMERWVRAMLADGRGYGLESDAMAAVRRDLELLDGRLAAERSRVLIVIDDLDRCEPEKAVEMLQAINLLLDRPSFIICLGIDARVVTAAVERHYRELLGPAGITGYEYLDKIVQIPFSIPEPTADDLADFVTRQMNRTPQRGAPADLTVPPAASPAPGRDAPERANGAAAGVGTVPAATHPPGEPPDTAPAAAAATPEERAEVLAALALRGAEVVLPTSARLMAGAARELLTGVLDPAAEVPESLSFTDAEERAFRAVTPFLRRNPRHVKRLVNVYALVRSLATLRGERRILDDPGATVRWLTLCGQWPYATREMLRAAAALERGAAPPLAPGTPPLAQLLAQVTPGLDPARRKRFDHAPELLADLVATSGDLSWDELLVLRRYTLNFNPALESELRGTEGRRTSAEG
jgi:Cdc6-like AAA superfamily ATPase